MTPLLFLVICTSVYRCVNKGVLEVNVPEKYNLVTSV